MSLDFLRKDSFYFMRDIPPDVKRYLPQWLNKDPLFNNIQTALNIEHENYRLALAEFARQLYVETTSDFQRWEQLLKITPAADASDDLRRAAIRVKRRGASVMTVERAKELLADFAPRGEVDIRELGENKLELLIHNGTFWWNELMKALMDQLPAHLTFDFEISRTINHLLYVGIPDLQQGLVKYEQRNRETVIHPLHVLLGDVASGFQRYDMSGANIVNRAGGAVRDGMTELVHGKIRFECENEIPDEETLDNFERYLRRRWAEFQQNPVIEYYRHHRHGDEGNPIISGDIKRIHRHKPRFSFSEVVTGRVRFGVDFYDDGIDDDPFPPLDTDFLRIWWSFPYETAKGEPAVHLRTTTHYDPRGDLTAGDIKALGEIGKAGEIFVWGKDKVPTSGILRAVLVNKKEMKII